LGRSAIHFILVLFQLPELVWVDEAVLGDLDAFHDRDSRGGRADSREARIA
jgi:hypothetical protein